uniref:Uncharacterized protein n=2 Tax=Amphora coffeiformis TaxID=265554 RepID=A0A7S3KZN3_9STRA|mmetsp:Transcript_5315/g.10512  ORF Transcript_5315/g.10512 Transcript_5315/m.10512 type:complete len:279 (+) Transcript_5315:965-1801(+)
MGFFALAHFIFRFGQLYFGDPSAGYGTRLGKGPHIGPALCLIPHAVLALSSLIFHTVPKERVVGKPMIWQEYRIHNIAFGIRSVVCTFLAWLSTYHNHAPSFRRLAVVGSCAVALASQITADWGTRNFRASDVESTTATMPYWEGCSLQTQKRFKIFYAYSQFMATLACIAVVNPAWSLSVLLAIQLASLFMTLVRKGIFTSKMYHIGYTITLLMPFAVGMRSNLWMPVGAFPGMMVMGAALFTLRARFRINKYALWLPIYAARIAIGDSIWMPHNVW